MNQAFRYLHMGLPEQILKKKLYGDFPGAITSIDLLLEKEDLDQGMRGCLAAYREILLRTPEEYPYTREAAMGILRDHMPDFTEAEFDALVEEGVIKWIYVQGQIRYFNRFFGTICKTKPAIAKRAGIWLQGAESTQKGAPVQNLMDVSIEKMKEQGSYTNEIRIRAWVKVKDDVFTPGMFVRVHLPLPSACEQQKEITIEKISPQGGEDCP